jgi:hypothetical protein
MAAMWQTKVQKAHQMIDIQSETLDQLKDCWNRIDTQGSVTLEQFVQTFKKVFPPWRLPVDPNVSVAVLRNLFIKIDANDDGVLTCEYVCMHVNLCLLF